MTAEAKISDTAEEYGWFTEAGYGMFGPWVRAWKGDIGVGPYMHVELTAARTVRHAFASVGANRAQVSGRDKLARILHFLTHGGELPPRPR
jgi:hypothetical protein